MKNRSKESSAEQMAIADVQQAVRQRAISEFGQPAIADELVNRVSLRMLDSALQDLLLCWDKIYRREVESWFSELQSYCQRYTVKLVGDPEAAADICQDCLKELLSTLIGIRSVKAWICRVAHNKAVSQINKEKNDRNLVQELKNIPVPEDPEDSELPARLDKKQLRKLLSRADYSLWLRLREHKSLKEYAHAEGISYQAAKERKRRVRTNLRSAWLRQQGWADSPQILSYNEFRAVQRFISRLLATCCPTSDPASQKQPDKIRNPKLNEAFQGIWKIHEWTVSLLDEGVFSLLVVGIRDSMPVPVTLKIRLDRTNRVRITDCQVCHLMASVPTGDARLIREVKGRRILRYEELLRLVPEFTVLDQERFDQMLADLKRRDHA